MEISAHLVASRNALMAQFRATHAKGMKTRDGIYTMDLRVKHCTKLGELDPGVSLYEVSPDKEATREPRAK